MNTSSPPARIRQSLARIALAGVSASLAFGLVACRHPSSGNPKPAATEPLAHFFPAADSVRAPKAKDRPHAIIQHGETRIDSYAWLKDTNWQQVLRQPEVLRRDIRRHLERENAYYQAVMGDLDALRQQLFHEMRGRLKEDDASVPAPDGPHAYYTRYRTGGEYPIYARQPRAGGVEQILLDGDKEAGQSEFFKVAGMQHSPDHQWVSYGVDRVGSEYYTLHIRRAGTDEERPDRIQNTGGYAIWGGDSQTFFYVEHDANQRPKRVRRHQLGTDPARDPVVYDEADDGLFVKVRRSRSGAYIFITSENQTTSETRFIPADDPMAQPVLVAPRREREIYEVEHHRNHFYIRTDEGGAVDYKIVRAPVHMPGRAHWEEWLPHRQGTFLESFTPFAEYLVRWERVDARPTLVVSDYEGRTQVIDFPEPAYRLEPETMHEFGTTLLRFAYESPTQPRQVFDLDMATGERRLLKTEEIPSGHDPTRYVVERLDAKARDGALVPLVLLRLKQTPVDGTAPVYLYGYGSYGHYIPDGFQRSVLSLVDRGVICALAHIRGGSARGWQWYLDGKLDKKIVSFTDMADCTAALAGQGYAAPGRVVIHGVSAGGLLVAATVNLDPNRFAGVVAEVPFVDVLNTMSDESLPLTPPEWPEWGDPIRKAEEYAWIRIYSPYENIRPGTRYPPILATGGLTDFRVTYWEPAKWVARLRKEAKGGPFLLKMNMGAGHAGAAARFQGLEEEAHVYAFVLRALGLEEATRLE